MPHLSVWHLMRLSKSFISFIPSKNVHSNRNKNSKIRKDIFDSFWKPKLMLLFVLDEKVLRLVWIFWFVNNTIAFRTKLFCFFIISYKIAIFWGTLSLETRIFFLFKIMFRNFDNQLRNPSSTLLRNLIWTFLDHYLQSPSWIWTI